MACKTSNGESDVGSTVEVIIAGAGPVGLLLALLLARKGIRSKVFEKNPTLDPAPRAIVHFPLVLDVFKDAGIYDTVFKRGHHGNGNMWRKPIVDDGQGGKALGPEIARLQMGKRGENGLFEEGNFAILYNQSVLVQLVLDEITKTNLVEVYFSTSIIGFDQDESGVTVRTEGSVEPKVFRSQYLVGCDGARSTIRKSLGINFSGHTWPERLLATDVRRTVPEIHPLPAYFQVDKVHWGVILPLEKVESGKPGMWRYAINVPDPTMTDEEVEDPKYVNDLLLKYVDGPRPAEYTLVRHRVYRLHQRLASTMHRGRVLLAGDAAHITNPVGGLGLCTGVLDIDLLAQTFDQIYNHDYHDPQELLAEYSSARRFVFQTLVSPISSANKIRLHESDPDKVAEEDWFLRALRRGNPEEIHRLLVPLQQMWRTNISSIMKPPKAPQAQIVNGNPVSVGA